MYAAMVVRLGRGRWHCVRSNGSTEYHTRCGCTLRDSPPKRVERKNGDPSCKDCIRWCRKQGFNV